MDLLSPNLGVAFWTVITFTILVWILKKLAWKPILDTLETREKMIKQALDQAEHANKEAENLLEQQRTLLHQARKESTEIVNESKKSAEGAKKELIDQAQQEAENILERAKYEIDLSKQTAISEIRQYAVDLSLTAAQKVIGEALTKDQHFHLIEKTIDELNKPDEW